MSFRYRTSGSSSPGRNQPSSVTDGVRRPEGRDQTRNNAKSPPPSREVGRQAGIHNEALGADIKSCLAMGYCIYDFVVGSKLLPHGLRQWVDSHGGMVEADLKSYVAMAYCIYRFAGGSMSPQKVQSWIRKYGGIAGSDVKTSLERWYIITRFIHSVLSAWDWRLMSGRGVGKRNASASGISTILSAGFTLCNAIANRILPGKALRWLCDYGGAFITGSWLRVAITFYILGLLSGPVWSRFRRRVYGPGRRYKLKVKLQLQKLRNIIRRNPTSKFLSLKANPPANTLTLRSRLPGRYPERSGSQGRSYLEVRQLPGDFATLCTSPRIYAFLGVALVGFYLLLR